MHFISFSKQRPKAMTLQEQIKELDQRIWEEGERKKALGWSYRSYGISTVDLREQRAELLQRQEKEQERAKLQQQRAKVVAVLRPSSMTFWRSFVEQLNDHVIALVLQHGINVEPARIEASSADSRTR